MAEYEDPTPDDDGFERGYRRESPEVYRRRRIIALILALLVIVLIVWGVVFAVNKIASSLTGGSDASTSAPPSDNFASFSARPSPSASGSGGPSGSAGPSASSSASASGSSEPSESKSETPSPSESSAEAASGQTPTESEPAKPEACGSNIQVNASLDKQSYGQGENPVMTAAVKNTGGDPCNIDLGASKVTYDITSGPADVYNNTKCGGGGGSKEATLEAGGEQKVTQPWDRTINANGCGDASQPAQPGYYWLTVSVNGVPSEQQQIVIQ
ncbi:hypothetical protein [Rothia uropygialis]|uniref:hypothetical protein n=1 Tax=Kocuria sp. 36 TaxID=1415402 RepID=UPI00101DAEC9|nr:hypothetical protein [Kocuria sp. 36]